MIATLVQVLAIPVALGLLVCLKDIEAAISFLKFAMVVVPTYYFVENLSHSKKINVTSLYPIYIIILMGSALQFLGGSSAVEEQVFFFAVSIAASFVAVHLLQKYHQRIPSSYRPFIWGIGELIVFLILILFGTSIHGTKAWIMIGSKSLQLTEFTKVISVLFYVSLFDSTDLTDKTKFRLSTVYVMVNCSMLGLLNELGTLLILLTLHLVVMYFEFDNEKYRNASFLGVGVVMLIGALVIWMFKDPVQIDGLLGEFFNKIHLISTKIIDRFLIVSSLDSLDPSGIAYQQVNARNALWVGGAFGSDYSIHLPAASSDYIFVYLILNWGLWIALLVMLLFTSYFYTILRATAAKLVTNHFNRINVFSAWTIYSQVLLVILGTTNVLPMTGLGIPFLSSGGTLYAISFILLALSVNSFEGGHFHEKRYAVKQTHSLY